MTYGPTPRPADARFWEKVAVGAPGDCWEWTGSRNRDGYGRFMGANRSYWLAHRWAFVHARGPIEAGLQLDHLCRNRSCVNPAHLEPVTNGENVRRGGPAQKTHCVHGHEFTPANTYRFPHGGRGCRECHRLGERARRAAA